MSQQIRQTGFGQRGDCGLSIKKRLGVITQRCLSFVAADVKPPPYGVNRA